MDSTANILQFCRLCLVKDGVNIPIFDEQGDIRQIYLKISSCLPVKVAREDHLPKKICDGCSNKLDNFYDFWRTSAESEKQLLSWLGATGKDASQVNVKEEENFDEPLASDISKNDDDENKCYMFEQKVEEGPPVEINDEPPPSKRPRRTAAVKAAIAMDQNSDDDGDSGEPITKMEDDSDETDGDDREPAFVDVPSTSADDQPGPSGVSKDGSDAPIKHLQADEVKVISKKLLDFCNNSRELKRCEVCHTKLHLTESHICTLKERKATNELNHTVVQSEKGNTSINGCTLQYRCSYCKLSFESDSEADRHIEEATCTFLQFCKSCQEFCAGNHEDCKGKQLLFCVSCRVSLKSDKVAQHGCFHTLTKKQQEEDAENIKTDRKFIVDCNLCGRLLPSSFKKTHYIRNHSNKTPRKTLHTCSYCLKTFSNLKDFRKHKRVFHEPFLCHVCGKQIISNEPKSHVDSHENVKRYKCSVCDKSFTFRDCLRKHVVIHSNEAKFICSTCGKHFKRRDNLVVHMRSHAEIKPFPCMLCDKTFTTKQWRDSHIKTHTMEELMKMERRPQTFRRKEMSDV
nr:unnamed protein product [Callosobruchus analis]